jgi:poly(3-hydroxybutyrate) depolymerase
MRGLSGVRVAVSLAVAVSLVFGLARSAPAQDVIKQRVFKDADGEHKYGLFVPKGYTSNKKWPVLLFLHGAGERGSDGVLQTTVGLGPVVRKQAATFPFIAVFPQCEDTEARYLTGWTSETKDAQRALAILESVEKEFSVDPNRRVLTGWSMGGYGSWSIAAATPDQWSAIVPLAGGGTPEMAAKLKGKTVWAFHGAEDAAIRPSQSRRMIASLRENGGEPRYTEVTRGGHEIAEIVYGNGQVLSWMLDPKNAKPSALALSARTLTPAEILTGRAEAKKNDPFVPALILKSAAKVRLGNRMLDALAMAIPEMLPKDLMSGRIADIYDSTVVDGRKFSITFGRISYSTEIFRIRVKAYKKDKVNVQIGLRNASLRIGGSSVVGRDHSATTGPIDIVIGHRYPVWISFDVTPYIEKQKLRLKLIASRFDISNDNWYVTQPAAVSVRGFGMTRRKVSAGLVSGLYGNRGRIEREVRGIVPKLVAEMEKQLSLDDADELVGSFWPLPVYKPRVRVIPEAISVDKNGISLILGVEAAAVEGAAPPKTVQTITVAGIKVEDVSDSDNLVVAVAPNMLQALTGMLVETGVARIHVLDIPEASFDSLVDVDEMSKAIPELKKLGPNVELWTELVLAKPIEVRGRDPKSRSEPEKSVAAAEENAEADADTQDGSEEKSDDEDTESDEETKENSEALDPIFFSAPQLRFIMKVRTDPAQKWKPFAEFDVNLKQAATAKLATPKQGTRALQLEWTGEPELSITGRFTGDNSGEKTIDTAALDTVIRKAWHGWTGLGPASQTVIPDLDFGLTKLRLSEAGWTAPWLTVTFSPPGVKLTNSTDKSLVYETKGPYSKWGGPYTLAPGKTHRYDIAYPMTWRTRIAGQQSAYTLIPGTHSEFRAPRNGGAPELFRARENLDVVSTPEGTK